MNPFTFRHLIDVRRVSFWVALAACGAIMLAAGLFAGCGGPSPTFVREPFRVYVSGPLQISYDYVREAGGEPATIDLFRIDEAYIERKHGSIIMTFVSHDTNARWSVNLDESQRTWVLEAEEARL
jgi:hypothetical protein